MTRCSWRAPRWPKVIFFVACATLATAQPPTRAGMSLQLHKTLVAEDDGCIGSDTKDNFLCAQTSGAIIILDAGSTGTRAHVFKYSPRKISSRRFPLIVHSPLTFPQQLASFSTYPGLSSFVNNTGGIEKSMYPLLKSAADALLLQEPSTNLKHVPVYIGATAGMRELEDADRDRVMEAVRKFCLSDKNPFAFLHAEQARVLAGEEEGAFGWLAVNQMKAKVVPDPRATYGALDFGGSSMQVTFVPMETSILADFFPMHINSEGEGPIHLYSHSFLGYGMTDAFQRATAMLNKSVGVVEHPCLPKGLVWHVNAGEFGVGAKAKSPERLKGPLTLQGTGDFAGCRALARKLIVLAPCSQPPCSLLGVYQPRLNETDFVVFGEYAEFASWQVSVLSKAGKPLLQALEQQMNRICSLPVATQMELFGTRGLTTDGMPACWRGTWMLTFLNEGLRFPLDSPHLKIFEDCCTGSLGQAIYEVNFFPFRVSSWSYAKLLPEEERNLSMQAERPGVWAAAAAGASGATALILMGMVLFRSGVAFSGGFTRCSRRSAGMTREPLLVA
mmetsp:Transcript_61992/g.139815  ORF Transcript_61992/g.139815 Transcript_61992/m.139815 type:complete len:559 (-) Transcript_61992:48-1724(-)